MKNVCRLSVNINKVALIRNSRGGHQPDIIQVAMDCERFGAQGITVHPRPDQRHIRFDDVSPLKEVVNTEFNIEGYPDPHFIQMVCDVLPHQVTLVPDDPHQLTSDHGWDTIKHASFLRECISEFKSKGIRVSLFLDADPSKVAGAAETGADRVELYTGPYAKAFPSEPLHAIAPYIETAQRVETYGMGLNAGHDLNLNNLAYFFRSIPTLQEVSIGHALICDSLYLGLENTIKRYLNKLAYAYETSPE
jgi:pyridoxine 5-phosphate synthase